MSFIFQKQKLPMPTLSRSTKLYRDFKEIEEGEYHTIIRFYEAQMVAVTRLPFERYFEILVDYSNALFEVGAYDKHLDSASQVIQLSIEQNIQFYRGEDIYFKSLYQKAASHHNRLEYEEAIHILKELIKIAPHHELSIQFLKRCLHHSQPRYIKIARAASIVLFLGAAVITATEVIYIHPFSPSYTDLFEQLRFTTLGIGLFVLIGTFLYHRYRMNHQVNKLVKRIKNTK